MSILAASLLLRASAWSSPPIFTLNNGNTSPYTTDAKDGYIDLITIEAFRRVGIHMRLVQQPSERGLQNANSGYIDGDVARIMGMEKLYPNLIRVPEKLMDFKFSAFSRESGAPVNWAGIRARRVGYIRGWKIFEKNLSGAPMVVSVNDTSQLFHLLEKKRVDVALYEERMGIVLLKRPDFTNLQAYSHPVMDIPVFIYLNRRHAYLAPKLACALRDLKAEGFYETAYQRALSPRLEKVLP